MFDWDGVGPFPWAVLTDFLVPLSQDDLDSRRPLKPFLSSCNFGPDDPILYILIDNLPDVIEVVNQVKLKLVTQIENRQSNLFKLPLDHLNTVSLLADKQRQII